MCGLEEWVLPRTVRDLVRLVGQVGSHREYEHPVKPARVTISGKLSSAVHPKRERRILRQAGLIGGVR